MFLLWSYFGCGALALVRVFVYVLLVLVWSCRCGCVSLPGPGTVFAVDRLFLGCGIVLVISDPCALPAWILTSTRMLCCVTNADASLCSARFFGRRSEGERAAARTAERVSETSTKRMCFQCNGRGLRAKGCPCKRKTVKSGFLGIGTKLLALDDVHEQVFDAALQGFPVCNVHDSVLRNARCPRERPSRQLRMLVREHHRELNALFRCPRYSRGVSTVVPRSSKMPFVVETLSSRKQVLDWADEQLSRTHRERNPSQIACRLPQK